ncbi:MAG: response regulator [Rhodospirillales bacterium]|nr:response regulator [Rhodospirillales bacterium]
MALKRRKRVLIVDDEAMVRDLLADVLSEAGYQAVIAPTWDMGETGFDEIGYSLVITDIFMPGRDGLEVIRDIQANWPEVKILAISGGWQNTTPERATGAATKLGATASLQKPFSPKELISKVEELIGEA